MNPEYVPELIAKIALADPRVKRADPIERRAQLEMWIGILADVPLEFALHAAQQHYATSQWAIVPGDIATRWQEVVRDRMRRHTQTFEPADHPDLDPDDISGFLARVKGERRAVVYGELQPTPVKAITAGAAKEEVDKRMEALGNYLSTEVREQLDNFRPIAAERARIIRSGHSDPLGVACPHIHCLAAKGDPCRNIHRRARKDPHPSRIDLSRGAAPQEQQAAGVWPQGAAS